MNHLIPPVDSTDHVFGPRSAPIVLVEFGDFQCPYCGAAYPELKAVKQAMGDKLCFVFRNFPLAELHPHALRAAEFAEAAGHEGKFWQMHDMLFEHQNALDDPSLVRYAQRVGLTEATIESAQRGEFRKKVEMDFESGNRSGVQGTPWLFINGEHWEGAAKATVLLEIFRKAGIE
jgi:protein-disulfide isomerase